MILLTAFNSSLLLLRIYFYFCYVFYVQRLRAFYGVSAIKIVVIIIIIIKEVASITYTP